MQTQLLVAYQQFAKQLQLMLANEFATHTFKAEQVILGHSTLLYLNTFSCDVCNVRIFLVAMTQVICED